MMQVPPGEAPGRQERNGMSGYRWALVAVCGLCLGGCEQESEHTRAIESATDALATLLPEADQVPEVMFVAAGASAPADSRKSTLERIVSSLTTASRDGSPAEKASALVLTSNAHLGLAKMEFVAAQAGNRTLVSESLRARATLGGWLSLQGTIAALARHDPTPELRKIDAEVAELAKAVEAERTRQQGVEARVASLRASSAAESDKARAERQSDQLLREQARNLSETEALALIEQAAEHRRKADAFDAKASDFEAQAAQAAPELGQIALELTRLNNQRASLERARQDVQQRTGRIERQASDAKADATGLQTDLEGNLRSLATLFEGDLAEALNATRDRLDKAIAAGSGAARDAKSSGNLALAAARHMLGDVEWTRAQACAVYASLMRDLASAEPALHGRTGYSQDAQRLDALKKEALERATEAYSGAMDAYQASGARGEASAAIERLGTRLRNIVTITSEGRVDLLVPESEAPDAGFSEPSADAGPVGDEAQVAAVFDALLDATARGDLAALRAGIHATSPAAVAFTEANLPLIVAFGRLDRACEAQFGETLSSFAMRQAGAQGLSMAGLDAGGFRGSDMRIVISGDRAKVTAPVDGAEAQDFIRVGGVWKQDVEALLAANPMLSMAAGMFKPMTDAVSRVAGGVEQGRYSSLDAVMQAVTAGLTGPGGG